MPTIPQYLVVPPKRRRRKPVTASPALSLTAAVYDTGTAVTLTFNRAVDITGIVPSEIVLDDGQLTGERFLGSAAVLTSPTIVRIDLTSTGFESATPDIRLTASAASNITASGTPWQGVTDLELPFG